MDLVVLPIPEDIYDIDTFELKDKLDQIEKQINLLSQQNELSNQQQSWLKKAKKIQELASVEIMERKNVEMFGAQCINEEKEFFEKLDNSNPYFNQLGGNAQNNFQQQQQSNQKNIQEQLLQQLQMQSAQNVMGQHELCESHLQQDSQQFENDQSKHDIEDSTSTSSKSTKFSKDLNEHKFMQQKTAIQQTIMQGAKSKNQAMQEFMRKTLQATKITDNRFQNFVGHSSNNQNYQKYVPPTAPQQPHTSEGVTRNKQAHKSLSSVQQAEQNTVTEDYSHVQSKVRENIISQSKQPTSIYFSTGKAPYPKYKPPKPKKEEPKRHRLQRKLQSSLIPKQNKRSLSSSNLSKNNTNSTIEQEMQSKSQQQQQPQEQLQSSKSLSEEDNNTNSSSNSNNNLQQQQQQNQKDNNNNKVSENSQIQQQSQSKIEDNQQQQQSEQNQQSDLIIWKEEDGYDDDSDDDEIDEEAQNLNKNDQKAQTENIQIKQQQQESQQVQNKNSNQQQQQTVEKDKIPEELTKEKQINIKLEEQAIISKNIQKQMRIEDKIPEEINIKQQITDTPTNIKEDLLIVQNKFDEELLKKAKEECEIKQIIKQMKYKVTDAIKEEQIEESMANLNPSQLMKVYQNQELNQIKNTVKTQDNSSLSDVDNEDDDQNPIKLQDNINIIEDAGSNSKSMGKQLENIMNSISDPTLRAELQKKISEMESIQKGYQQILDKADESEHLIKKKNIPGNNKKIEENQQEEEDMDNETKSGSEKQSQQQQQNKKITSISTSIQPVHQDTSQSKQQDSKHNSVQSSQKSLNHNTTNNNNNAVVSQQQQSTKEGQEQQNSNSTSSTSNKPIPPKKHQASPATKQPSVQSKLLLKMMQEIHDDTLVDYSQQFPQFQSLFSGFYNNCVNFNLMETMREIYYQFAQHVERVDNADKGLLRYKTALNPLEVTPAETYYVNDPRKVLIYQNRMNINLNKFVQNQYIQSERIQGTCEKCNQLQPHETLYYRTVKSKQEVYDIVTRSFLRTNEWQELPHGMNLKTSWNLLWTWSKPQIDMNKLIYFQKVNHFPFNKNIGRKDLLKKNIERVQRLGQKTMSVFDIIPTTFVLPKEYCNFSEKFYDDMTREGDMNIWIMKPIGKSRGRGISLVNDISQVVYAEPMVVQKYLKTPLLLNGYKFDMRIYVVVTSFKPLEVFLYKEGFARMSTELFNLDQFNLKNALIHLTNYSIQKYNYDQQTGENYIGGTKITLKMLRQQLEQKGIRWEKIWTQVQEIIIKSLVACQQDIPYNPNCFELFGYDIIIDNNLRCMLLEINQSPSLARDYIIDDLIKQQLMDDIIELVDPVNYDRARLLEVLDRRIREEQGCKSTINTQNNSKLQLNRDLNYILRGQPIRKIGEMPKKMGSFERIAPCELSEKLIKIIQSYKCPTSKSVNMGQTHTVIDF